MWTPVLAALIVVSSPERAADTLVICPPEWTAELGPWFVHRARQGYSVAVVPTDSSPVRLRQVIRRHALGGRLRFLVLVGDAQADPALPAGKACVPTHYVRANVNIHWGSEPEIASDDWYADLDDDRVPDIAVGRLTADSAQELAIMVEKILAYERSRDFGPWRRRVNFVAGLGGFGALEDRVLELAAKSLIVGGIPAPYATTMTYASTGSPYCPGLATLHDATVRRLNEGCLFWVYLGHGHRRGLDRVRAGNVEYRILEANDITKLDSAQRSPIALLFSCYGCAMDGREDCLAEQMLRTRGGPVAVIGGSRVTMPYGMAALSSELIDQYFIQQRATLGETLLHAKRSLMLDDRNAAHRATLDVLASALNPSPTDLAAERLEHVHLFHLIGDPLLRMVRPGTVTISLPPEIVAGETLHVAGACQISGHCTLELVTSRGRLPFKLPQRRAAQGSDPAPDEHEQMYHRANDPRLASGACDVRGGRFSAQLPVPKRVHGPCHVRVFVQAPHGFAIGSADVTVRPVQLQALDSADNASLKGQNTTRR